MAPIKPEEVPCMVDRLKAGKLLQGYRRAAAIDMEALIALVITFSDLLMALADQVTSIDLNSVSCSSEGCVAADARIMQAGRIFRCNANSTYWYNDVKMKKYRSICQTARFGLFLFQCPKRIHRP